MTTVSTLLDRAEIVELSGADAPAFAQSQFSSDVSALAEGAWHWSAWLDAQGRVRYLFALLHPQPGQFIAWLPRGLAAEMASELTRFVFRSKVAIRVLENVHLLESGAMPIESGRLLSHSGGWTLELPGTPTRTALLATGMADKAADPARLEGWRLADIDAGLPWISAATAGEFTPQALGLDKLGAASLGKGCYPGQEVVARLHYRGGNKRACFKVRIEGQDAPVPGTRILSSLTDTPVGTILHAARADRHHCLALAVLAADRRADDPLKLASTAGVEVVDSAR